MPTSAVTSGTPTPDVPAISFDPALPISARVDDIEIAIRDHQVVVVAGETGSGKTTQLPKICLRLGRRTIAHTQPRRIAARTVAERIAEEVDVELGDLIGYQVRFTRKASRDTRVKVMTDGVLLAEISHDRDLRRYDTIIIDEAHERSLNIDFLLGYLKQLLPRRPELKVIITSATIDTVRFAEHFADEQGEPAPIVEVSGRTYPVEIRYRPLVGNAGGGAEEERSEDVDQVDGIGRAVEELIKEGDGDILVFLSGEREIRDAADALNARQLRFTEVLPLYARLSAAEQHRVFSRHTGRRVVLATNVAETSLTVPGIRYVIDAGTARISRYSARTKVQRLPIEPISQASANQRSGRCGRLGPGICIRLYAEEDFLGRPEFTEPEILRTNLASVILKMADADLGEISSFPFVEPPESAQITEGLRLLDELGALKPQKRGSGRTPRLTKIGVRLAGIPIDPRMARMLLAGERQGCLREMLIIVSGLSVQDPRERPAEHQQAADQLHRRFWAPMDSEDADPDGSDFIAILRLWRYLRQQQKSLSGNAFRRMCRDEYLHFLRIREWQDLHQQLRQVCRELKLNLNDEPADHERIHTAILTGLLSHVGMAEVMDERRGRGRPNAGKRRRPLREYLGARGTKFAINPGSSVAKISPPLVMAAEIVETSRLWARTAAAIDVRQVEQVGRHLLKHTYSEPHWSARNGAVMAYEQVSLYGVVIIGRRQVPYAKINPAEAREIFIRSALVEGDWRTRHRFFAENRQVRTEAEELEERTRRRDLLVDDQVIFDFYDARIPADVTSGAHFDRWWKDARQTEPERLRLTLDDLVVDPDAADTDEFPEIWTTGEIDYRIEYSFQPGSARDGVSIEIPVTQLNRTDDAAFSWQVPGLRSELAAELIRSLPKSIRREFVPAPEHAQRALAWIDDHRTGDESFPAALGRALRALTGVEVPADAWLSSPPPAHLLPTYVIKDGDTVLAEGKDITELKRRLAPQVSHSLNRAAEELTVTGATDWRFGTISDTVETAGVISYPGLVDEGSTVGLKVYDTAERRDHFDALGLRRLVMINIPDPTRWTVAHLGNQAKLALGGSPYPSVPALLADARLAAVGELIRQHSKDRIRDQRAFRRLCDLVRADHADRMRTLTDRTASALELSHQVRAQLDRVRAVDDLAAADLAEQLDNLIFSGFLAVTDGERLPDLVRYLQAALNRVQVLLAQPAKDAAPMATITRVEDAYAELCAALPDGPLPTDVEAIGWMLEELRVGLFAQQLRTKFPVSEKRTMSAIAAARRAHGLAG